jgi:hypothetical protein
VQTVPLICWILPASNHGGTSSSSKDWNGPDISECRKEIASLFCLNEPAIRLFAILSAIRNSQARNLSVKPMHATGPTDWIFVQLNRQVGLLRISGVGKEPSV